MKRFPKWLFIVAPVGFALFIALGGVVVQYLWNNLLPPLFGLPVVGFWQALGILALSRILFGGFGFSGGGSHRSHRHMGRCGKEMTRDEVEQLRQGVHDHGATAE